MKKFLYKPEKDKELELLHEYRPHTWIHIEKAESHDIKQLAEDFSLDEAIIFDALDAEEVPRIETDDHVIYFFARFVYSSEDNTGTAPILLIVKRDVLITITPLEFPRIS